MQIIDTPSAPRAIGPYSQATVSNDLVFCSGQIALDPTTGEFASGSIEEETHRVLTNLKAVLEAAGASLASVVKTTIYLASMSDFAAVNKIYAEFFSEHKPARVTIGVAELPRGAKIEIEATAERVKI